MSAHNAYFGELKPVVDHGYVFGGAADRVASHVQDRIAGLDVVAPLKVCVSCEKWSLACPVSNLSFIYLFMSFIHFIHVLYFVD